MDKTIHDELDLTMIKEWVTMNNEMLPRLIERIPVSSSHVFLRKRVTLDDPEFNQIACKVVFNAARNVPAPLLPAALGFTNNTTYLSALKRCLTALAASEKVLSTAIPDDRLPRHIDAEIERNLARAFDERVSAREILSGKTSTDPNDELAEATDSFVRILPLNCPKELLQHALGTTGDTPLDYALFARFVHGHASRLPALGTDSFILMLVKESRATLNTALERRL